MVETSENTYSFIRILWRLPELTDENQRQKVLAFIQSIVVYKFPNLSQKEIEAMLNLSDDIEKTGYFQSVLKITKLKVVPALLKKGLSIQEIAENLELDVEEVREVARGGIDGCFHPKKSSRIYRDNHRLQISQFKPRGSRSHA